MKQTFLLVVLLTCLVLTQSRNLQGSQCCSQCNISLFLAGPQTPSKLRDLLVTAISKNWNITYFVNILQQFPTTYFRELLTSVQDLDSMVLNGSSSCGGVDLLDYPNEYLPAQIIDSLYDSIVQSYTLNSSKIDSNYAQTLITFVNSLKTQFNNYYGIPVDQSSNDFFTSYQDDPNNQTIGSVQSSALASSLASSLLNSADPLILTAINEDYFSKINQLLQNLPFIVTPSNSDILLQMGSSDPALQLDFATIYNSRQPPYGLRTFRKLVDTINGDPFGSSVITRLAQIDFSSISLASDSVKATLASSPIRICVLLLPGPCECDAEQLYEQLQRRLLIAVDCHLELIVRFINL